MAENWTVLANSALRPAVASMGYPSVGDPAALVTAWNSATVDTKRKMLVLPACGGHADWGYNDVWGYDYVNFKWLNLRKSYLPIPSPSDADHMGPGGGSLLIYPDNSPITTHTYDGVIYSEAADKIFETGSAGWGTAGHVPPPRTFDPATKQWAFDTVGEWWKRVGQTIVAINAEDGKVWNYASDASSAKLYEYDATNLIFKDLSGTLPALVPYCSGIVVNGQMWSFGPNGVSRLIPWGQPQPVALSGLPKSGAPGVCWEPAINRIVVWTGGADVYLVDPAAQTVVKKSVTGTNPGNPPTGGTYKRFSRIGPGQYIAMNSIDAVHLLTIDAGTVPPDPGPDPIPPTPTGGLADEKAAYTKWGWAWTPSQEPRIATNGERVAAGLQPYYLGHLPVHDGLEADDLWQNLVMWNRTGQQGYYHLAAAWADYYMARYLADYDKDLKDFGGCHTFGWGLVEWAKHTGDGAFLVAAKAIGDTLEAYYHGGMGNGFKDGNYSLRGPGRQLKLAVALGRRAFADEIWNNLKNSWRWDDRGTVGFWKEDAGAFSWAPQATGAFSSYEFTILHDGLNDYYEWTGDAEVKRRLILMARWALQYGMKPDVNHTASWILIDFPGSGQYFHSGLAAGIVLDPFYTCTLIDTLVRGYRITGEMPFLERAIYHWDRSSKAKPEDVYPYTVRVPANQCGHFMNSQMLSGGQSYVSDGELSYMKLFFTAAIGGSVPTPIPPEPIPPGGDLFTQTLECEAMPTKTTGGPTDQGWNIWSNGYVAQNVTFPVAAKYRFTLRAVGTKADGIDAIAEMRIDQVAIGTKSVTAGAWANYVFEKDLTAGNHQVAVAFTNDAQVNNEDRNLLVDKITIEQLATTTPPQPTTGIDGTFTGALIIDGVSRNVTITIKG